MTVWHEMAEQCSLRPRIAMETGSVMSALPLVSGGLGVALIDPFLAHLFRADAGFRCLRIEDGPELRTA